MRAGLSRSSRRVLRPRVRDHRKLRAFELADRLAVCTYERTRAFPKEEMFGLTAQLRRGAVSVPSNIVEGCARQSQADYLRFLDIAYAACRELEYQIGLSARLGFLDESARAELTALCVETGKVLAGLTRALKA